MIENIKMRNIASFDNNGVEFHNLNRINFIYGSNGTGKSTISHFLNEINEGKYSDCSKTWKNELELNSLVYNRKFREENFGKGKINGVFTLGKATQAEKQAIEDKLLETKNAKEQHLSYKTAFDAKNDEKKAKEDDFKENKAWSGIYKKYEDDFKEAFKGFQKKLSFKDKLLTEFDNNTAELISFKELKEKAETILGEVPVDMDPIQNIEFEKIINIELSTIWGTKIIGKSDVDIAKLIQRLNINDWVNEGKKYIQEDVNTCPFCQQDTITENFKSQLDSYFDESFVESNKKVANLKEEYLRLITNLENQLNLIEISEKSRQDSKLNIDLYSSNLKTLLSQFSSNKELLNNKEKEPSRSINLKSTKEQIEIINSLISDANIAIEKHNNIARNYKEERENLISSIWKYIIEENKIDLKAYKDELNGIQLAINNLKTFYESKYRDWKILEREAIELSKNLTSIEPTINEINDTLRNYGFLNFKIVPAEEKNFYQIRREDGTLAESTLSEGEITFITFLYFLQLAKGALDKDKVSENKILVIDDPVSSLDSNVLFVVSTLIKNIINDIKEEKGTIKQLILFTHNVYFHKEVSFINGRTKECKFTWYWILRKNNTISNIQFFEKINPIKTSYCLLWDELKDRKNNSLISIQNVMRRIIENYFKILGKYGDDNLVQIFNNNEEREICKSLISWINDGSHSINDDLYIEYQDETIEKYMNVFRRIFIETKHEEHYNMMMGSNDLDLEAS